MVEMIHIEGKDKGSIKLFALSTCVWCKKIKRLLDSLELAYDYVYVDTLKKADRDQAMDELKPEYKEVIVLTKIEGLSYKEISDRLGKSNEAVRKLVSRAMAVLTSVFESD